MKTYVTVQNDRLDRICQRHHGACRGVVEKVLAANPRLAEKGALYPPGLRIMLPEIRPRREKPQVRLWD